MLISLRLGEKCDQNCTYCDYNEINKPKRIKYHIVQTKMPMVFKTLNKNPEISLSITGGETGLISEKILRFTFDQTKKKFTIPTNGLFLRKKYHIKFGKRIRTIYYHCTQEIGDNIIISPVDFPRIEYIILIHKNNIKYLDSFLSNNEKINFTIKLIEQRGKKTPPLLDIEDLEELIHILKNHKNYKHTIMDQLTWYLTAIDVNKVNYVREKCSTYCYIPQIDFVHDCIRKCYKSYTEFPTIELTRDNLIDSISFNIPDFKEFDDVCKKCTYLYQFTNIDTILKERVTISLKNGLIQKKLVGKKKRNGKRSV